MLTKTSTYIIYKKINIVRNKYHHRKSGSSKLLVASIYSIVELKIMKLVEAVKFFSPYRKNWAI